MRPQTLATDSGQASLEAAVASLSLLLFAGLLLALIYFCLLGTYLPYASHEFLVCREISDPWTCEKQFRSNLKNLMRWGRLDSMWVQKEMKHNQLHLQMSFPIFQRNIRWHYHEKIFFP